MRIMVIAALAWRGPRTNRRALDQATRRRGDTCDGERGERVGVDVGVEKLEYDPNGDLDPVCREVPRESENSIE